MDKQLYLQHKTAWDRLQQLLRLLNKSHCETLPTKTMLCLMQVIYYQAAAVAPQEEK